jgi:hypothetical protein
VWSEQSTNCVTHCGSRPLPTVCGQLCNVPDGGARTGLRVTPRRKFKLCPRVGIYVTCKTMQEDENEFLLTVNINICRSQWPRCLKRRSAAAWLLGSRV